MFATDQLQAHRGERRSTTGVSEGKEVLNPDAQLQRRARENERVSFDGGGLGGIGDAQELVVVHGFHSTLKRTGLGWSQTGKGHKRADVDCRLQIYTRTHQYSHFKRIHFR